MSLKPIKDILDKYFIEKDARKDPYGAILEINEAFVKTENDLVTLREKTKTEALKSSDPEFVCYSRGWITAINHFLGVEEASE